MGAENYLNSEKWHLSSMTGIGRALASSADVAVEMVVRSVNYRGLDIKCRLPDDLEFFEPEICSVISEKIGRGRVEVYATVDNFAKKSGQLTLDEERAEALLLSLEQFRERFAFAMEPMSLGALLSVPGVLNTHEPVLMESTLKTLAASAIKDAVAELARARKLEGNALKSCLATMLNNCARMIKSISDRADTDVKIRYERLCARMAEIFKIHELNQDRCFQELAFLAERADFKEEIDRLKAHVHHFSVLCQSDEGKGRKLDFLCQEMLRESNTLLSKAAEHSVIVEAIELKAEIERIREQIQNIE